VNSPTLPANVPPALLAPFVILLLLIAFGPLCFPGAWNRHYPKVAFTLAVFVVAWCIFGLREPAQVWETTQAYFSFIILIGSLFVVSGGIHITVKGEATPLANVAFLLAGAIVSNLLGTTGASMLLIRPWLRMNQYRVTAHHVVFFIFIVSNVGGCLTPIGDPPLFLGYLMGMPFWWPARHCLPMWALGVGVLLAMFYAIDRRNYSRAPAAIRQKETASGEWRFGGLSNLLFLAVILAATALDQPPFARETLMLAAAAGSWFTTSQDVHKSNHFNFHPIKETAILFAGIFATMIPALGWLQVNVTHLPQTGPTFFYFGTGGLSSVLDNAPTFLCFLKTAMGLFGDPRAAGSFGRNEIDMALLLGNAKTQNCVLAISIGSVFFGANTYLANGPNLMVKAIADQQKVRTPNFLAYVWKYSIPFMLPMLVLVWWLFFRN